MAKKSEKTLPFEASLRELEALVEKMEQGELSLEESLQHFERGIQLTRSCQQALKDAGQKVDMLLQKNGQDEVIPFDSESS